MKKWISVLLTVVLFAMPLCFGVSAADDDMPAQVCRITVGESNAYTVEPCEGYDFYVIKGESFKFTVKPKDGYSLDMALVYYEPTDVTETKEGEGYFNQEVERDPDQITYTIDAVNTDITIYVEQVLPKKNATFFRNLMEFIRMIFNFIGQLFGLSAVE